MALDLPGYRINASPIGVGAASKIYTALELNTRRTVAIKHVVRDSAADGRFLAQVETEYNICSSLNHPSLRRCFALHRVRKLLTVKELILVMEYVDGLDLETARSNRLNTFLTLFQKVAQGLNAMHEAGYVHTDIKPTNLMISKEGGVKIIDFGQSCPIHHRKERIQGTPDYIAPEQVRRMPLDQRTDVFNLGATMYWSLTSENYPTALSEHNAKDSIRLTNAKRPLAPNEHNDKIPLSLSRLVMECCRDNPSERPADMKQVVARLEAVRKVWNKQLESLRAQRPPGVAPSGDGTSPTPAETQAEPFAPDGDA